MARMLRSGVRAFRHPDTTVLLYGRRLSQGKKDLNAKKQLALWPISLVP